MNKGAEISGLLLDMFNLVDEQLANALNVIQSGDQHLARKVRQRDDEVDNLEMKIDRLAEKALLARPDNPVTIRFIMAAIKVNTDLERIGDHCRSIASSAVNLPREVLADQLKHFDKMVFGVREMLYAAQDALFRKELSKAWELVQDGHAVGRLHRDTLKSFVASGQSGQSFEAGARIYALSKALERIADHSVNIAESVLFWDKGIDVRHARTGDMTGSEPSNESNLEEHESKTQSNSSRYADGHYRMQPGWRLSTKSHPE